MPATIYDTKYNFDESCYGVGTTSDVGSAGIMVVLKPDSAQKVKVTDIQFGVRWSNTPNANAAATEIKVACGDIWVVEGNLAPADISIGLANFFDPTSVVPADTIKRFNLKVRMEHRYNNYNLTPLNNLNIQGKLNKTLYVLMNVPAMSANVSGGPLDLSLSLVVFGSFIESDNEIKVLSYQH